MTAPPPRLPLVLALMGTVVCLGFALFTGHVWEDYFITFRSSLNLATGHGLVYEPGQRVHSFTSPLGTLLPALFAIGGGEGVISRALWCYRLVCAAALGGALWFALRTVGREGVAPVALGAAGAAWALDPKVIDFSGNGMELGLLILFIAVTWQALMNGARSLPLALGFAGLQWTRPDGCVFFGVLAGAWILFGRGRGETGAEASSTWRTRTLAVGRGLALGLVAYLPWVIFAWSYYGSPIPHTIIAKVARYTPGELAAALALYPWKLLFGNVMLHGVFLPSYFDFGGWPAVLVWPARILALGAALAWVWPRVKPGGRVASAAFFLGGFYVEYIPGSPWYYPGWQSIGWIAWAYLLHAGWELGAEATRAWARSVVRITAGLLVLLQAGLLAATAWQMRAQQTIIEDGNRRQIGLWLREQSAGRRATVYLEPLGYIGYFSGLKMFDYPGLCSPEVVAVRRAGLPIMQSLKPDWMVFRPAETAAVNAAWPGLLKKDYRFVRAFDARPAIDACRFLPGRGYLNYDAVFLVFARHPDEPRPP